ncbi:hypothetical protein LHK_01570 [Laribacter hongkongensis HLHK9]|uniref:Uncharacterized protein n=1 Tax=Laribacter hongkongensis (strain HLHK9) TaxID=557598 RepID=C1D7W8_LARHH|nr:hypothetical protein LHK_01570 [Laribacter hongkongensis HLHK9]
MAEASQDQADPEEALIDSSIVRCPPACRRSTKTLAIRKSAVHAAALATKMHASPRWK